MFCASHISINMEKVKWPSVDGSNETHSWCHTAIKCS